ncbi:MAG TPA: glycosyltransferase family 4 protein, partial [Planctomycetota bacterium]|nr:glycosyltransferase family 4 protein [Planctomycetota bacterium]
ARVGADVMGREPEARVVVNGGNCPLLDINWVHMVHAATEPLEEGLVSRTREAIIRRRALRTERAILPRSRILIVNSVRTRDDLERRLGIDRSRIRLVYLGCETVPPPTPAERALARRWLEVPDDAVVVSFVGALSRLKGFDTLLDAWRALEVRGPRPVLVAAGAGPVARWRHRIDALGLADSVRLLGPISRVPELLAASDLVVGPSRYDAYGLAIQEALARGIPAITTSRAGISERYPESLSSLILEDVEDSRGLAQKIARAIDSLGLLRDLVSGVGATLRARSWRDMACDLVEAVETERHVARS